MPNVTGLVRLVPGTHTYSYLPNVMQVFWNARESSNGIDGIFSNLAQSLTNNIRMTADDSTTVIGEEGVIRTFVEVRWPLIILLCVSVCFGTLFLALAMSETSRSQTPLWKDSQIAALFHGLSNDVKNSMQKPVLASAMEQESEGINVRLINGKREGYVLGMLSSLCVTAWNSKIGSLTDNNLQMGLS